MLAQVADVLRVDFEQDSQIEEHPQEHELLGGKVNSEEHHDACLVGRLQQPLVTVGRLVKGEGRIVVQLADNEGVQALKAA